MTMICRKSMSECRTPGMCSPFGGCQDPAQSELAALREERDRLDASVSCMSGHVLAYKLSRQRLLGRARARELHISDLQQRLADAERRNAVLVKALTDTREALGREYWDKYAGLDETRDILDAALQPTESGASE